MKIFVEEEKTCSLLSAMESKDLIAQTIDSAIGQQKRKLEKLAKYIGKNENYENMFYFRNVFTFC